MVKKEKDTLFLPLDSKFVLSWETGGVGSADLPGCGSSAPGSPAGGQLQGAGCHGVSSAVTELSTEQVFNPYLLNELIHLNELKGLIYKRINLLHWVPFLLSELCHTRGLSQCGVLPAHVPSLPTRSQPPGHPLNTCLFLPSKSPFLVNATT